MRHLVLWLDQIPSRGEVVDESQQTRASKPDKSVLDNSLRRQGHLDCLLLLCTPNLYWYKDFTAPLWLGCCWSERTASSLTGLQ